VEKNLELGQSLGVNGTPTLIFANGERVGGGMGATDFVAMLEKAGKEAKKR
jgi:thiol:disulfide interchange protein DsbC